MVEYIDKQAAIDAVHKSILDFFDICDDDEESPMTYKDERLLELNKAITTQIKATPSADVRPVHRRKWRYIITAGKHDYALECTACGRKFFHKHGDFNSPLEYNYCPFCGSKMEKGCYE